MPSTTKPASRPRPSEIGLRPGIIPRLRKAIEKGTVGIRRAAQEFFADAHEFQIAASNLTGTKARFLLMACLLKFGSLPAASDPDAPTTGELSAIRDALAAYQVVFDTH